MNSSQTLGAPASPGRALNITLWALQALLAAFFGFAGVNKLLGLQQEMVDNFARLGPLWFRYFVGVVELIGAIALVIPRLSALGALWLVGVMVGAIFTHLLFQPPAALAAVPAVLGAVLGLLAWRRWSTTPALARLGR